MMEPGIEGLLAAAIGGNQEAENKLFLSLRARILELVQQRIWNTQRHASEIRHDAENLAQDICFVILQKYKTASLHHGFMPWVFQIVWYKIGEYYRRRKGSPVFSDEEAVQTAEDPAQPLELIESKERDRMIFRALKRMDRRCKAIIKALLQDEIDAYMDAQLQSRTPPGSIYARIHRCRKRFQKLLSEEGFEK